MRPSHRLLGEHIFSVLVEIRRIIRIGGEAHPPPKRFDRIRDLISHDNLTEFRTAYYLQLLAQQTLLDGHEFGHSQVQEAA